MCPLWRLSGEIHPHQTVFRRDTFFCERHINGFKRYSCGTKVANLRSQPALLRKKLNNTGMLAISIRAVAASTSGNRHVTNALSELK